MFGSQHIGAGLSGAVLGGLVFAVLGCLWVALCSALMEIASPLLAGVDFTIFQSPDALLAVVGSVAGGWLSQHLGKHFDAIHRSTRNHRCSPSRKPIDGERVSRVSTELFTESAIRLVLASSLEPPVVWMSSAPVMGTQLPGAPPSRAQPAWPSAVATHPMPGFEAL